MVVGSSSDGRPNVWRKLRASPLSRHALGLLLLLTMAFAFRVRQIHALSPYVGHMDEATWTAIAMKMRQTGDLNPRRFNYPSLPVYLMTVGVSLGLVRAELAGEASGPRDFEARVNEYYRVPSALEVPKYIFALASVVALGLTGVAAYLLTRRAALLWLAPLIACVSKTYLVLSWRYMNVDMLGAAFVIAAVTYAVWARTRHAAQGTLTHGARHAIVLGVLSGLAVGSKYILATVLVPSVLLFAFYEPRRYFRRSVTLGAVAVATFYVTTPFALLDAHRFFDDIMREARHYATGHPGHKNTVDAGLPMLGTYVQSLAVNFGALSLIVALAGAAALFRRDPRTAAIVYAHPIVFVGCMSLQRVFFPRNAVALHLFVALAIAIAIAELPPLLAKLASRRMPQSFTRWLAPGSLAVVATLVLAGIPWPTVANAYSLEIEPRNEATRWIRENVPRDTPVFVDSRLDMDLRPLARTHEARELSPRDLGGLDKRPRDRAVVVVTSPSKVRDDARVLGRTRRLAHFRMPRPRVVILELRPDQREDRRQRRERAREREQRAERRERARERKQRAELREKQRER